MTLFTGLSAPCRGNSVTTASDGLAAAGSEALGNSVTAASDGLAAAGSEALLVSRRLCSCPVSAAKECGSSVTAGSLECGVGALLP